MFAIEIVPALCDARAPRPRRDRPRQRDASTRSTAAAAGRRMPPTTSSSSRPARRASRRCLAAELADGGRLVIPLGGTEEQTLARRPPHRRGLHDLLRHTLPIRRPPGPVRCRWRRAGGLAPGLGRTSRPCGPLPSPGQSPAQDCSSCSGVMATGRRCIPRTRPDTGTWSRQGRRWISSPGARVVPVEDILELNGFESAALVKPGTLLFVMTGTAPEGATSGTTAGAAAVTELGPAPGAALAVDDDPRPRRFAVRRPLGKTARGDRSAGTGRNARVRRGRRPGGLCGGGDSRLRQPGRAQARGRSADRVRAQLGPAGLPGAVGPGRRSHRRWSARAGTPPGRTCTSRSEAGKFLVTR